MGATMAPLLRPTEGRAVEPCCKPRVGPPLGPSFGLLPGPRRGPLPGPLPWPRRGPLPGPRRGPYSEPRLGRSDLRLILASERSGEYRADKPGDDARAAGPSTGDPSPSGPQDAGPNAVLDRLDTSVAAVGSVDLTALGDRDLDDHLRRLRRPIAALEAARARALAEVERRAPAAARPERQNADVQEARRRAAKGQGMTPSEAKRTAEAGRHAGRHRATGDAFDSGDINPTHVRLIGEALERLPEDEREEAELELLELARTTDAVAFGRAVRALLARRVPEAAQQDERRRHNDRRFRMTDTADGGVAFSGLAFGTAAELARTALSAFRRPDTPDEHRTPDQRGADAFEQVCAASLRLEEAPTVHGERPQVIVVIDEDQLEEENGVARFAGSDQPVTMAEAGTLLDDCSVSRLVRGADGTPIEVSKSVRTVPAGLWRALVVRDGGCRWDGCDAPASWCDVAHGKRAYRDDGRLSPSNAVLLCRRHHRRFDQGTWRLEIDGDQVSFHRKVVPFVHPLDREAASRAGPDPGAASGSGGAVSADEADRDGRAERDDQADRDGQVDRGARDPDGPRLFDPSAQLWSTDP